MKKKQQNTESEEGNRNSSRLDVSHAPEASSQSTRKQRQQTTVLASRQTLLESSANDDKTIWETREFLQIWGVGDKKHEDIWAR